MELKTHSRLKHVFGKRAWWNFVLCERPSFYFLRSENFYFGLWQLTKFQVSLTSSHDVRKQHFQLTS